MKARAPVYLSAIFTGALAIAFMPFSGSAAELELVSARSDLIKSSVKAVGKGLEHGDFLSILRAARTKSDLVALKHLFYSRVLKRSIALNCRYGAAPRKRQALNLDHAVELRVDVPLNLPLKNAALSVEVEGSNRVHESAAVLFSFSF